MKQGLSSCRIRETSSFFQETRGNKFFHAGWRKTSSFLVDARETRSFLVQTRGNTFFLGKSLRKQVPSLCICGHWYTNNYPRYSNETFWFELNIKRQTNVNMSFSIPYRLLFHPPVDKLPIWSCSEKFIQQFIARLGIFMFLRLSNSWLIGLYCVAIYTCILYNVLHVLCSHFCSLFFVAQYQTQVQLCFIRLTAKWEYMYYLFTGVVPYWGFSL